MTWKNNIEICWLCSMHLNKHSNTWSSSIDLAFRFSFWDRQFCPSTYQKNIIISNHGHHFGKVQGICRDLQEELIERIRLTVTLPVRIEIIDKFDATCTELLVTASLDSGGRGRPRVIYDVTAALSRFGEMNSSFKLFISTFEFSCFNIWILSVSF